MDNGYSVEDPSAILVRATQYCCHWFSSRLCDLARGTFLPSLAAALLCCAALAAVGQAQAEGPLVGAEARIERLRKADFTVAVQDARGRPVRNATVEARLTKHAFLFGCAALSLTKHDDAAREFLYQKRFGDLFNFATVLSYWQDTEPERGRINYDLLSRQARRLKDMGIRVKGHPLILAGASPRWAPADPDAARELTRARIADIVKRFKGEIDAWDVVGDATTARGAQNGLGAWARKAGPGTFTAEAFRWARAANPSALLVYNDYKLDVDFTNLIEEIDKAAAPVDVLGLEAHMVGSEWPLQKVWDTADTFSRLKRPLHFSEVTVLSDDPRADHSRAWPTPPEGEQRQADYVEKLYTLLFSHPAVEGIGWWNFVDGDWDRSPAGLLRADLTAKPAYDRLLTLIHHRWHTEAMLNTGNDGAASSRGFAGRYHIVVRVNGKSKERDAEVLRAHANRIVVRLP